MSGSRHWPALREGDVVQIVAPSGPFDAQGLEQGIALLQTRYEVRVRPDVYARSGYLAGDDTRRASELMEALHDDQVKGLIAARGGYGSTRLLHAIDVEARAALSKAPKLLVGFSDITALHALWQRAGVGSLHASMAARVATLPPAQQSRWLASLEGRFADCISGLSAVPACPTGRVRGTLVGGNLAVLYALVGTPYMPDLSGTVVFLEDVNERPYAVDRMLTALRDSGAFSQVAGYLLGTFTEAPPGPDGTTVGAVLTERLASFDVPILTGLSAGHIDDNQELPFGAEVELDPEAGTLKLPSRLPVP